MDTFSFAFYNDETDVEIVKTINVSHQFTREQIDIIFETETYMNFVSKMETEYGVHDVSYCPDTEIFGFTSYEIAPDQYDEVMQAWEKFIITLGFTIVPAAD